MEQVERMAIGQLRQVITLLDAERAVVEAAAHIGTTGRALAAACSAAWRQMETAWCQLEEGVRVLGMDGVLREIDAARRALAVAREPPCENKHDDKGCREWDKGGECKKNPGFMKSNCIKACDACPPVLYEGKQATGLVRNAWARA